jgi:hypothetical protein
VGHDKDTVERAKEVLVYGPIGLALYMRDTAPSFLKVFVARGRAEFDERKRSVESQLGQVRNVGQDAVDQTAGSGTADQVMRIVSDGLGKVRETAEGAWVALGTRGAELAGTRTPSQPTSAATASATPQNAPPAPEPAAASPAPQEPATPVRPGPNLAIPDYDELSASQVVDRLDGLAPDALEAIKAYETAHRGRATILGKIEQLADRA